MGTVKGPDQTSSKPCIDICLSATALIIRVSSTRLSMQHQHDPFWLRVIILDLINVNKIILVVWPYLKINTFPCCLYDDMCMNEVNNWYNFVDQQMTKINALVLWFFHITMHSPFKIVHCSDEKIAGRVHWFLSFALQQNHIQSLTSNY